MTGFQHYKKREFLSISEITQFKRCPRRFFYQTGVGLREPAGSGIALVFGEGIHSGIGTILQTGNLASALEAFSDVWTPRQPDGSRNMDYELRHDPKRNTGRAALMLADFMQSHQPGKSLYNPLMPTTKSLMKEPTQGQSPYEVPFAIDIGLPVPLVGRIDCTARHRDRPNELWTVEYKTTSELSTRFLTSFELNPQVLTYALAGGIIFQEEVKGCFVEALAVMTKNVETLNNPIYIQQHLLTDHLQWLQMIGSMILAHEEMENFPKDFSGCGPYPLYGSHGYMCDYERLCKAPDWLAIKDTYIEQKRDRYQVEDIQVLPVPAELTINGASSVVTPVIAR